MENDLLCHLQMRMNDVQPQECPKFVEELPDDVSHMLQVSQDRE
jgi:hypothetical protein